ncbi:Uncharacterised protein [Candidatus Tiddalikarchaeum anstoanum]|nr:Uncharacterised protein [Candidatus Tiddalikarchaeum anstoanum]
MFLNINYLVRGQGEIKKMSSEAFNNDCTTYGRATDIPILGPFEVGKTYLCMSADQSLTVANANLSTSSTQSVAGTFFINFADLTTNHILPSEVYSNLTADYAASLKSYLFGKGVRNFIAYDRDNVKVDSGVVTEANLNDYFILPTPKQMPVLWDLPGHDVLTSKGKLKKENGSLESIVSDASSQKTMISEKGISMILMVSPDHMLFEYTDPEDSTKTLQANAIPYLFERTIRAIMETYNKRKDDFKLSAEEEEKINPRNIVFTIVYNKYDLISANTALVAGDKAKLDTQLKELMEKKEELKTEFPHLNVKFTQGTVCSLKNFGQANKPAEINRFQPLTAFVGDNKESVMQFKEDIIMNLNIKTPKALVYSAYLAAYVINAL